MMPPHGIADAMMMSTGPKWAGAADVDDGGRGWQADAATRRAPFAAAVDVEAGGGTGRNPSPSPSPRPRSSGVQVQRRRVAAAKPHPRAPPQQQQQQPRLAGKSASPGSAREGRSPGAMDDGSGWPGAAGAGRSTSRGAASASPCPRPRGPSEADVLAGCSGLPSRLSNGGGDTGWPLDNADVSMDLDLDLDVRGSHVLGHGAHLSVWSVVQQQQQGSLGWGSGPGAGGGVGGGGLAAGDGSDDAVAGSDYSLVGSGSGRSSRDSTPQRDPRLPELPTRLPGHDPAGSRLALGLSYPISLSLLSGSDGGLLAGSSDDGTATCGSGVGAAPAAAMPGATDVPAGSAAAAGVAWGAGAGAQASGSCERCPQPEASGAAGTTAATAASSPPGSPLGAMQPSATVSTLAEGVAIVLVLRHRWPWGRGRVCRVSGCGWRGEAWRGQREGCLDG